VTPSTSEPQEGQDPPFYEIKEEISPIFKGVVISYPFLKINKIKISLGFDV